MAAGAGKSATRGHTRRGGSSAASPPAAAHSQPQPKRASTMSPTCRIHADQVEARCCACALTARPFCGDARRSADRAHATTPATGDGAPVQGTAISVCTSSSSAEYSMKLKNSRKCETCTGGLCCRAVCSQCCSACAGVRERRLAPPSRSNASAPMSDSSHRTTVGCSSGLLSASTSKLGAAPQPASGTRVDSGSPACTKACRREQGCPARSAAKVALEPCGPMPGISTVPNWSGENTVKNARRAATTFACPGGPAYVRMHGRRYAPAPAQVTITRPMLRANSSWLEAVACKCRTRAPQEPPRVGCAGATCPSMATMRCGGNAPASSRPPTTAPSPGQATMWCMCVMPAASQERTWAKMEGGTPLPAPAVPATPTLCPSTSPPAAPWPFFARLRESVVRASGIAWGSSLCCILDRLSAAIK